MNRLAQEHSPYLLQHKDNPVSWWPWGPEAFKAAKDQNKPIFLSVGYSTCHWCHVMAHESFESDEVAEVLNCHFIPIKLDREERPDIDDLYMAAVLALTHHGGWPLSVWLLPDGRPFFGGTYFPKDRFLELLRRIHTVWKDNPDLVQKDAVQLTDYLKRSRERESASSPIDKNSALKILSTFVEDHRARFDSLHGGFGSAPKFPQALNLMALLRLGERALVEKTLDEMMKGGIHDHLMGGFHRYSVDRQWIVPHFEKMLYDQAWLARIYLEAACSLQKDAYRIVAQRCLDYVLREMTSSEGGFFSAQDADSLNPSTNHMEEGYFATFAFDDLVKQLSSEEFKALRDAFDISEHGNFEDRNILVARESAPPSGLELKNAFEKIAALRQAQPPPLTDDKILTAWNGWMISSFIKGYQVLGDHRYLLAAQKAAQFIWDHLWNQESEHLFLRIRQGQTKERALSDDFTAMIAAFLDLFETTGDDPWKDKALKFQNTLDAKFWDTKSAGYFRDDGEDPTVLVRLKEDHDGVRPNANSLATMNLLRLYHMTGNADFKKRAEQIFAAYHEQMTHYPSAMPALLMNLDFYFSPVVEVGIGAQIHLDEKNRFKEKLWRGFFPNTVIKSLPHIDKFVICVENTCQEPTALAAEAWDKFQKSETLPKN